MDESVAKAAGATGVVLCCNPEFWEHLGISDNVQPGKRLKHLVNMAKGETFEKKRYPVVTTYQHLTPPTWHVLPSLDALKEAARGTTVKELDAVINMSARMSGLRNKGLHECPTCAAPLPEDENAILCMYRGATGRCACGAH